MVLPVPAGVLRPDFAFLDIEASGLHDGSYPIEIAVVDDGLNVREWLVRPEPDWTAIEWSSAAEAVHGIRRADTVERGVPAADVATTLNALLSGKVVFSDAPEWDGAWLYKLHADTGVRQLYSLANENDAIPRHLATSGAGKVYRSSPLAGVRALQDARWHADRAFPHVHRAAPDAVRMAARFRAFADPDFLRRLAKISFADDDERGFGP